MGILISRRPLEVGDGGQVVREYECEQIVTLKGWMVLTGARLLARARQFRTSNLLNWEANPDAATA